jgi:hypothetical protein
MNLVEKYIDKDGKTKIKRTWMCCGQVWNKEIEPSNLEEVAWTPVCHKCGGFDGTFSI